MWTTNRCLVQVGAVHLHHIRGNLHVVEHALQLLSELVSALHLQLGEHPTLCIVRYRSAVKKAFRKVVLVITFEDVLVCKESEDCYCLIKHSIDLGVSFLRNEISVRVSRCWVQLTPLRPFFRLSSINNEINSGAFSFPLTNDSKACKSRKCVLTWLFCANHCLPRSERFPLLDHY